jgi:hypothetical protein
VRKKIALVLAVLAALAFTSPAAAAKPQRLGSVIIAA